MNHILPIICFSVILVVAVTVRAKMFRCLPWNYEENMEPKKKGQIDGVILIVSILLVFLVISIFTTPNPLRE